MFKYYKILVVLCVLVLAGCSNTQINSLGYTAQSEMTENSEKTEIVIEQTSEIKTETKEEQVSKIEIQDADITLMQKVLLNKAEFADGEKIIDKDGVYEGEYEKNGFVVVDLDHDGVNEVCIDYPPGEILILHEKNNSVYAYVVNYNGFWPVYTDGTFEGSGATASKSLFCGNISFENNKFESEIIVGQKPNYDAGSTSYFKGNDYVEITKEEYDAIMSGYSMEEAERYDFTIENILTYVK